MTAIDRHDVHERSPGVATCVADLDELAVLNQAEVLNNVDNLFGQSEPVNGKSVIYSAVGPVLVAMNPFKGLPLYGVEWVNQYRAASEAVSFLRRNSVRRDRFDVLL